MPFLLVPMEILVVSSSLSAKMVPPSIKRVARDMTDTLTKEKREREEKKERKLG